MKLLQILETLEQRKDRIDRDKDIPQGYTQDDWDSYMRSIGSKIKDPNEAHAAAIKHFQTLDRMKEEKLRRKLRFSGDSEGPWSEKKRGGMALNHNEVLLRSIGRDIETNLQHEAETGGIVKSINPFGKIVKQMQADGKIPSDNSVLTPALVKFFESLNHDRYNYDMTRWFLKWYANHEFDMTSILYDHKVLTSINELTNKYFRLKQYNALPRKLATMNNVSYDDFCNILYETPDVDYKELHPDGNVRLHKHQPERMHDVTPTSYHDYRATGAVSRSREKSSTKPYKVTLIRVTEENYDELARGTLWEDNPIYTALLDSLFETHVVIVDSSEPHISKGSAKYFFKSLPTDTSNKYNGGYAYDETNQKIYFMSIVGYDRKINSYLGLDAFKEALVKTWRNDSETPKKIFQLLTRDVDSSVLASLKAPEIDWSTGTADYDVKISLINEYPFFKSNPFSGRDEEIFDSMGLGLAYEEEEGCIERYFGDTIELYQQILEEYIDGEYSDYTKQEDVHTALEQIISNLKSLVNDKSIAHGLFHGKYP